MTASAILLNIVVLGNACLLIPLICVANVLAVRENAALLLGKHC